MGNVPEYSISVTFKEEVNNPNIIYVYNAENEFRIINFRKSSNMKYWFKEHKKAVLDMKKIAESEKKAVGFILGDINDFTVYADAIQYLDTCCKPNDPQTWCKCRECEEYTNGKYFYVYKCCITGPSDKPSLQYEDICAFCMDRDAELWENVTPENNIFSNDWVDVVFDE